MLNSRSAVAALVGVALCAGLEVATWKPLIAHAAAAPGIISTYAGGAGSGIATAIGQTPSALAIRGSTLYMADDSVIRALNTVTGAESVVAGTGTWGYGNSPDGGQATTTEIRQPTSIALDSAGNLFIGMYARVRRVDHSTGIITTVVGNGTALISGDGGPATAAQVFQPQGLAFDASDNLFIADVSEIREINHTTGIITRFAGSAFTSFGGDGGPAISALLSGPTDLSFDSSGDLFFADSGNNRIREIAGGMINTVAGDGVVPYFGGDGGPATSAHLYNPDGVWVDSSDNLWITDSWHYRVREVVNGIINTVVGNGTSGSAGDGGPATSAQLLFPSEAVGDGTGNLFVSDTGNKRLRKVSSGIITTVAGNGASCSRSGDGGPAVAATLCSPTDVAVDGSGDLFIADSANSVVREVNPSGVISTFAGDGTLGATGDGGSATAAELYQPSGMVADGSGSVFIADSSNNVVRKVTAGVITRFAGNYSAGLSGDGGAATSAQLHDPEALALDSAGNLYIADLMNSRIRKVTPGGVISTYAGSSFGNSGDGGPATAAQLGEPSGIAIDAAHNLYIADGLNSNIRKVDVGGIISTVVTTNTGGVWKLAVAPGNRILDAAGNQVSLVTSGGLLPVAGTGEQGGAGDGGLAINADMYLVAGVAVDSTGNLFVADDNNQKIRRIEAYQTPSAPQAVRASPGFNYSAKLKWAAPATSGGLPITSYIVRPSVGTPVTVAGSPPPLAATVSDLSPSSSYTFTVAAATAWGSGPASSPTNALTPLVVPPGGIATNAGSVGAGAATSLGQVPYAVAVAGSHLLVGDLANPVVRDLNIGNGQETALAGNDSYGYSGDGGQAASATVYGATAIAFCGGDTYIADNFNYVIRKIDSTGVITTVAGTGKPGFSGDGHTATSAQLSRVLGLACRSGGGLYISDSDNGRVRILDTGGRINTWWYGFSFPTGIVETGQDMVDVSDTGANIVWSLSDFNAVRVAGAANGAAGSGGDQGLATSAQLNAPRGLAFEPSTGRLYIADELNHKIRTIAGGKITTLAGTGVAGFTDNTSGASAQFDEPTDLSIVPNVVVNGYNPVFVADFLNYRVRKIDPSTGSPVVTTVAGNGTPSWSGDGGQATSAQLGNPYAIAFDGAGNEYIADSQNNVIRKITSAGIITTVAGTGASGYSGDGGPASNATLNDPRGVAANASGDIFISDAGNNVIREVDHSTANISTVANAAGPTGIVVDASGNLYWSDTDYNRVEKIASGGPYSIFAGTGTAGYGGDGGLATGADLNGPQGLAIDSSGNLLIADTLNHRVRQVAIGTGTITTIAGNGQPGLTGDLHLATSARLASPHGVAFDPAGNLFIADTDNERIRMVDTHGIITSVVGACGIVGAYSGDGGPAALGHVNAPFGLATNAVGNLFIAEIDSNRIRVALISPSSRGTVCPSPPGKPGNRGAIGSPPGGPPSVRMAAYGPGSWVAAPSRASSDALAAPIRSAHLFPVRRSGAKAAPRSQTSSASKEPSLPTATEVGSGTKPAISARAAASPEPISPWFAALLAPLALLVVALVIQCRRQRE